MRNTDSQQQSRSIGSAVLATDARTESMAGARAVSDGTANAAPQENNERRELLTAKRSVFFLIPILLLLAWCYAPAIVNAFHGDDFLHVRWLTRAAHETKLLFDNFVGPWMGDGAVKFYRPLISVTLWLDYKVWGFNAAGFHLTNVLFHVASAFCLFFIGQRLASLAGYKGETARTIGIFTSLLWGVYPLSAEAVAWITGRVDATVTAFSMGSLLTYLQWRESKKPLSLVLSLGLFVLALLCKEMAIIIPPLFAFIDLLFSDGTWRGRLRSLPFWGVLGGYFALRQITMGTMIGAYDDSLGLDLKFLWKRFKGGMPFLLSPFNMTVFNRGDLIVKVWLGLLGTVAVLGVAQLAATKLRVWRLYAFCLGWFVLALIPVYKVFDVAPDLESSRYAYLATVPLCLALSAMAAPLWRNRLRAFAQCAVFAGIVGIAAFTLHTHNEVWNKAGLVGNNIRDQIDAMTSKMPANPMIVLVGVPDNVQGAYVMRNALPGMVTPPYFPRTIASALTMDRYCAIWPFAVVRDFWSKADNTLIARWDDPAKNLVKAKLSPSGKDKHVLPLDKIRVGGGTAKLTPAGLKINAPQKYTILDMLKLQANCADFDFVQVTLKGCPDNVEPATMVYVNDLHPNAWPTFSSTVRSAIFKDSPDTMRMVFSMRQHPEWTLGGKCTELVFGIPSADYTIESIQGLNVDHMLPKLVLPPEAHASGFLNLTRKVTEVTAAGLGRDQRLLLELSPRFGYFEKQYVTKLDPKGQHKQGEIGKPISIVPTEFKPGMYQARLWIADAAGNTRGLSSDHFMLVVP